MRAFLVAILAAWLVASAIGAEAKVDAPRRELAAPALLPGDHSDEVPAPRPAPARLDTIDFGFYEIRPDGQRYAVRGGIWTWDHGAADPLEGWTARDQSINLRDYWRQMTEGKWIAEGNPLPWPRITGSGLALCGASEGHADTLGWAAGIGYGNDWCQRLTSPPLVYDGTGTVDLQFAYFNDTEIDYDYTKLFVVVGGNATILNAPGFTGRIGIDSLGVLTPPTYLRSIQNADFGGGTAQRGFTLRVEFKSDGNLSDEDGNDGFDCFYGPVGLDDLTIQGGNLVPPGTLSYSFDADLQGWTASRCPGIGSYMGLSPVTAYNLQDPCACELAGQVLEFHNESIEHPEDQHEQAWSPIIDRIHDIGDPVYLDYNQIMAEWDVYADLPQENGVLYRSGWSYYPYENPNLPGVIGWSPRMGIDRYYFVSGGPTCGLDRNIGTDWGLPPQCQQVRFIFELMAGCDNFGIDPCSGVTNFSPIIDNLRVRNIGIPNAPSVGFEAGTQFQDGYGQSPQGILSTTDPGNADITRNSRVAPAPARLGDSLVVRGPNPTASSTWESTLWFRLRRAGPGQASVPRYQSWRAAMMAKGIDFTTGPRPDFTWGFMDSVEVGGTPLRYKFCSQFRDGPSSGGGYLPADPCYNWGGGGEQAEGNEILPDLCLVPGTQVEYFVTTNYTCLPSTRFYLPDTTGAFFSEFEILPSYRLDQAIPKFPCLLYIDAFNRGAQFYIENALNVVLEGAGSGEPIPNPAKWDRYDYLDAASNWHAAFYRDLDGNNGATIPQLLGYKLILLNTGNFGVGCTWARDWQALQQWVDAVVCEGNSVQQGLILDGTAVSEIIEVLYPALLTQTLGAYLRCPDYNAIGCPGEETQNDDNYCVQVDLVPGSPFDAVVPADVVANWCPPKIPYAVLGGLNSGQGNRHFVNVANGDITQYAQIINDRSSDPRRYRTVLNGFSYHLLTARDLEVAPDPAAECPLDSASRVTATYDEIAAAIRWVLDVDDPGAVALCVEPGDCGTEVPEETGPGLVNRLYPNRPNPFNPRTAIRYALAAPGRASLVIYDVQGRRVKTLVDGHQDAGQHEVAWDRTNDAGELVSSGIFWSQLTAGAYRSSKKMVVLK